MRRPSGTDQYGEQLNDFEAIVSEGGKVLAPQTCLHGGGPSCELLTHAWFLGERRTLSRRGNAPLLFTQPSFAG